MYNPYPLDPAEVDAFFQGHDLAAPVGTSCDDGDCPLARFLNAQYPGSRFVVHQEGYGRLMDDISLGSESDDVFPLPAWARDFVQMVDASGSLTDDIPVSALDALCFLHAACDTNSIPCQEG